MHIVFDMYGVIIKESKGNFIPYVYNSFPGTDNHYLIENFTKAGLGYITGNEFISYMGFSDAEYVTKDYIENFLTLDNDFIDLRKHIKISLFILFYQTMFCLGVSILHHIMI